MSDKIMDEFVQGPWKHNPRSWYYELSLELREKVRQLYLHSSLMNHIICMFEIHDKLSETERLWKIICSLVEMQDEERKRKAEKFMRELNTSLLIKPT